MTLNHGDMFILHPKDEQVIIRQMFDLELNKYKNESRKSKFQHGVECKIKNKKENHIFERTKQQVSISVCLREANTTKMYL